MADHGARGSALSIPCRRACMMARVEKREKAVNGQSCVPRVSKERYRSVLRYLRKHVPETTSRRISFRSFSGCPPSSMRSRGTLFFVIANYRSRTRTIFTITARSRSFISFYQKVPCVFMRFFLALKLVRACNLENLFNIYFYVVLYCVISANCFF